MKTERRTKAVALIPSIGLSGGIKPYARAAIEALSNRHCWTSPPEMRAPRLLQPLCSGASTVQKNVPG
jgi:hypothetical protein